MTRLNLVLLLAVLASALYLVNLQYESRRLVFPPGKTPGETPRPPAPPPAPAAKK